MDPKQFKDFTDEWKGKGALDFTRRSHYEPMAPLFEAHAEVVQVTKEDFHNLGTATVDGVSVTTFYPRKETTDKFGAAAGLAFKSVNIGTRKESPLCFVGKAQTEMLGPDGQMISMAPAEYEYDAEVRADLEILGNMKSYKDKSKFNGPNGEIEKKLCIANHRKVGRRRADTGARAAAIIAAIGSPTGFKNLFNGRDTVYFLFSRVIYNAKNKMVMDRALDSMFGAAKLLAGPSDVVVPADEQDDDDTPPMRPAEGQHTTSPAARAAADAFRDEDFEGVDDAFDGITPEIAADMSPRGRVQYVRLKYAENLSTDAKAKIDPALGDMTTTDDRFKKLYWLAQDFLNRKGITVANIE